MMSNYKSFETKRLLLKPTDDEDAAFLIELLNSPKWIQYIGDRNVKTLDDAKTYIAQKVTPQFQKLGFGNYTVIRKSDGIKLGTCGLYDREGLDGIDIGFAFLPQFEKMGYAFESANHLKNIAFEQFEIHKLSAITIKENIDSQNLIKKLGFKFMQIINIPNDEEDLLLYQVNLV
jgi:RimJ/RimL family protein N-acetyltransferase